MAKWMMSALFVAVGTEAVASVLCVASLVGVQGHTSLLTGPGHLACSPEHFLALIAVGIWSGRLGGPASWTLPLSFMAGMALGFLVGASQPMPTVEHHIQIAVLVSTVALVVAATLVLPVPSWEAAGTLMMLGLCQGYADGVGARAEALLSGLSFAVTAVALLSLGVGVGQSGRRGS